MQPITIDAHGVAVLFLTVVALFLFTRDRLPLESSSLAILIILVAGFELFPYRRDGEVVLGAIDFFAGFGNEALIAISALMMVGKALETTGALATSWRPIVGRAWSSASRRSRFCHNAGRRRHSQRVHEQHANRRVVNADSRRRIACVQQVPGIGAS